MLVGAVQGVVGAVAGLYLSFYLNIASGATIVLVLTSMFVHWRSCSPRGTASSATAQLSDSKLRELPGRHPRGRFGG